MALADEFLALADDHPRPGVRRPRPIFAGDGQNHGNGLADERLALADEGH